MDALPCPDIKDGPWTLVFQDGQDFCNHASKIIGAVYVSPADAAARIARTGSFGTTFGKVGATGPTPLDAESIAGQYMVELALAEYRDDPTPVMAEGSRSARARSSGEFCTGARVATSNVRRPLR